MSCIRENEFKCYICGSSEFKNANEIIKHLRKFHSIKENKHSIHCLVNNPECEKQFQTFNGMRKHMKTCLLKSKTENLTSNFSSLSVNEPPQNACLESNNADESSPIDIAINILTVPDDTEIYPMNDLLHAENTHFVFDSSIVYDSDDDTLGKLPLVFNSSDFVSNGGQKEKVEPSEIAEEFFKSVVELGLNQITSDRIFKLATSFVRKIQVFSCQMLRENIPNPEETLNAAIDNILNKVKMFDSSSKRSKLIESHPGFVKPIECAIGTHWEVRRDPRTKTIQPAHVQSIFSYVSLIQTIESLFRDDKFMKTYFEHNRKLKHKCAENVYTDICCGEVFKQNLLFQRHPESLQIQLFIDGFELCDGLKTKTNKHSQVSVYFFIRNMPPELAFDMNNIHLLAIINASDLKKYETDYTNVLEIIQKEINVLETEGIDLECGINLKGSNSKQCINMSFEVFQSINFDSGTLVNFTFDNLGGNSALGFAESLSAKFFCRTCLCSKEETQIMTRDNPEKYRTKQDYDAAIDDIRNSQTVDLKKTKGIREYCVLNNLKYFHILQNMNADIMHDLCEGVLQTMTSHFFQFGISRKLFSESELINFVSFFDYGVLNRRNMPSDVRLDRKNLNQNASQMKCLVQHLPFIFSHLKDEEEFKNVWLCVTSMLTILKICYSSTITNDQLDILAIKIEAYLKTMIETFGVKLKPKDHIMTHYPHIIRSVGPLVHMSTMKFEMKHKDLTNIAKSTNNFRNINKTLAKRYQEKSFFNTKYENKITSAIKKVVDVNFLQLYGSVLDVFPLKSEIYRTKWVKINSDHYEKGLMLKFNQTFFEINCLLYYGNEFFFICSHYEYNDFDEFFNSIKITKTTPEKILLVKYSDLHSKKSYEKKMVGESIYLMANCLEIESGNN